MACQPGGYTPAQGRPLPTPTCPGQSRADRVRPVLFFSDAVFAIAITLLIVNLQVPDVGDLQSGQQLRDTLPQIGHVKGLNWSLMLLNLLFLGCIAFLPYPTALLSAADDQVSATIFYAAAIAAAGLVEAAVWLYAIRIRDLALRGLARGAPLGAAANPSGPGGVPAVDPGAIIRPDLAKFLWLLVFVSGLALRGLEPADEESATIDELGG